MLKVLNVSKYFSGADGDVTAVNGISFEVPDGNSRRLSARAAAAKAHCCRSSGPDKPDSGQIEVAGQDITRFHDHSLIRYRAKQIGFVFQNYNLVPNLTALENVMLPMEFAGVAANERKPRAMKLLDQVGLSGGKQQRKPGKLSGGEQQRVAIARPG